MQMVSRIMGLPFWLNKDQRRWLEAMRKDKREEVRSTAEWAYGQRYGYLEQMRRDEEQLEEMDEEWEDLDEDIEEMDLDEIDKNSLEKRGMRRRVAKAGLSGHESRRYEF